MRELSDTITQKISGPTSDNARSKFLLLCDRLLSASETTHAQLTTIYVKFCVASEQGSSVYAVVWIPTAKKWDLGLALPEGYESDLLGPEPPKRKYAGLNKFIRLTPDDQLPAELGEWAQAAFTHVVSESEDAK